MVVKRKMINMCEILRIIFEKDEIIMPAHKAVCQNDGVNYNFTVIVDDRIATTYPYHSWLRGGGYTAAQAAAQELTLALNEVFSEDAAELIVEVDDTGKGYDVTVNGRLVTSYPYSGVWIVGGLIKARTKARADAYQLGQNLSAILHAALHQK
jgi:hypothetical protein